MIDIQDTVFRLIQSYGRDGQKTNGANGANGTNEESGKISSEHIKLLAHILPEYRDTVSRGIHKFDPYVKYINDIIDNGYNEVDTTQFGSNMVIKNLQDLIDETNPVYMIGRIRSKIIPTVNTVGKLLSNIAVMETGVIFNSTKLFEYIANKCGIQRGNIKDFHRYIVGLIALGVIPSGIDLSDASKSSILKEITARRLDIYNKIITGEIEVYEGIRGIFVDISGINDEFEFGYDINMSQKFEKARNRKYAISQLPLFISNLDLSDLGVQGLQSITVDNKYRLLGFTMQNYMRYGLEQYLRGTGDELKLIYCYFYCIGVDTISEVIAELNSGNIYKHRIIKERHLDASNIIKRLVEVIRSEGISTKELTEDKLAQAPDIVSTMRELSTQGYSDEIEDKYINTQEQMKIRVKLEILGISKVELLKMRIEEVTGLWRRTVQAEWEEIDLCDTSMKLGDVIVLYNGGNYASNLVNALKFREMMRGIGYGDLLHYNYELIAKNNK